MKTSIGRRLAVYILLFSSVVTLVSTAVQLTRDYRHDVSGIAARLAQISDSYASSLSSSRWVSSQKDLQIQLDGIMRLPDMQYIEVIENDGSSVMTVGKPRTDRVVSNAFKLSFIHREQEVPLGKVVTVANLDSAYQNLKDKILVILVTQGVKTFLVSFFILFLFDRLVGHYLRQIARHSASIVTDGSHQPVVLQDKEFQGLAGDELDQVVVALNDTQDRIAVAIRERDQSLMALAAEIAVRTRSEASLQQAASVFNCANEGIMITDQDGSIIDVNQAFCRITGFGRDEVIGRNPRILKSGRHSSEFYKTMWHELKARGGWISEVWNRRKNGEIYAQMQTISAVLDPQGKVLRYVSLFSDITELKEHQHELERIAHYDALTNLPNRVLMADRLRQAMAQVQRHGSLLAVLYLDLDGFKAVNDAHGHDVGDHLLTRLAERMKQSLREGDTLARIGGDEFVAVLLDLQSHEDSAPILERLLAAAATPVYVEGQALRVSASIGVSFFPQAGEAVEAEQLMRQADQAMYQAKQAGKNRYHIFDAEHDRSVRGHHESLERIRQALENREFVLYYQPKVNMRSGEVVGAEALIRWQHPERGLLPPGAFLPVIERNHLMIDVGNWVLDTALTQIETWRADGFALQVSVNVDALQLEQTDFVDQLRELLARHPSVQPGDLELEVLETSALENIAHLSEGMLRCRTLGVGFALDDFGTGYSSLTYLKRLPANLLKIDQSFVRDMLDDPEDLAIIEGVLGLAQAFRRQTIAEGVETLAHGQMLLRMGCVLGQGYAIARPMPAHAMTEWMASWQPEGCWAQCGTLHRDEMPLLFAEADHRAWVLQLGRHLRDEQSAPPMETHLCRFGKWLETIDRSRFADHPARGMVVSLHERIHRLGDELLNLKQRGFTGLALERMREVEALQDGLLEQLHRLQK